MSNQYRLEQDRDVICLIDAGRLMSAPLGSGTVLDAALEAAAAVTLVADELGDRAGAIAFDAMIRASVTPARRGAREVVETLFDLEPQLVDSDFEAAFIRVARSRRAIVFVFCDLIDETAARSLLDALPMLTRHHGVAVACVRDPVLDLSLATPPRVAREAYAMAAALNATEPRERAAAYIRRSGALLIDAPAAQLPDRCVAAYMRLKSRAR